MEEKGKKGGERVNGEEKEESTRSEGEEKRQEERVREGIKAKWEKRKQINTRKEKKGRR